MKKVLIKQKSAQRIVVTSFLVDVSDIVINLIAAYLTGSVVMLTQTLQGLSDVSASGLTLWGLKQSKKKTDKKHPYGYGREIYFWTAAAGMIMFPLSAGLSFYFGLERFLNPEGIDNIGIALTVLIIGLITNSYSLSQSASRLLAGKQLKHFLKLFLHSSLVTTKIALILDIYGSLSSVVGIFALSLYVITGNNIFDGLGAMVIAILLAGLTIIFLLGVKDLIVGKSASTKIYSSIKKSVLKVPNVIELLDLNAVIIGPNRIFADIEVHLEDHLRTKDIEKITDQIKSQVRNDNPHVEHVMVEIENP